MGSCLSAVAQRPDFGGVAPENGSRKCLNIVAVAYGMLQGDVQGLHSVLGYFLSKIAAAEQQTGTLATCVTATQISQSHHRGPVWK